MAEFGLNGKRTELNMKKITFSLLASCLFFTYLSAVIVEAPNLDRFLLLAHTGERLTDQAAEGIMSDRLETDISVVVFDFGGVVCKAETNQMKDFLLNSFNIDKKELSNAFRDMQSFLLIGGSEKQFWEQYASSKKMTLANNWYDEFGAIIKKSITEIPETLVIIGALQNQGYQTAMLSDVTQYQAEIIRKMGYYDLFNPVLLSYEIGVQKPNPEVFKVLLEKLQVSASHVLFIDDRIENVEAAEKLGIDSIQFVNPEQLKKEFEKRGFNLDKITNKSAFYLEQVPGLDFSIFFA